MPLHAYKMYKTHVFHYKVQYINCSKSQRAMFSIHRRGYSNKTIFVNNVISMILTCKHEKEKEKQPNKYKIDNLICTKFGHSPKKPQKICRCCKSRNAVLIAIFMKLLDNENLIECVRP